MAEVIIRLKREEILACCIALDKRSYQKHRWFKDALAKLDNAFGFKKEGG